MQARQLSSTAARNLYFASPHPHSSSPTAEDKPATDGPETGSVPVSDGLGLAHDAGNLLGALRLYCDLLDAPGVLAPRHRHYASELRLIFDRSGTLLSRLLQLTPGQLNSSAGDSGAATGFRASPAKMPQSFHRAPAEVLRTLAPLLSSVAAPYATVTTDVTPHLPFVDLSSEAIERIAINLVRNASESIRHSQFSGGKIHVCLSVVAGRLRLSVEDNGPGMPPAQAAAFLHPAPLPPGAIRGYGHRNVHELAEITCGRLGIHVRPGRGTTLCVDWDIHERQSSPRPRRSQRPHMAGHLTSPPRTSLRLRSDASVFKQMTEGDQLV
jgi:hypothetical protein